MGVAVHEFGHALGLGHSSVEGSIMFPWYSKHSDFAELPEDDRIGIQEIYGQVKPYWRPSDKRTTTTTTSTTPRPAPTRTYYPYRYSPKDWPPHSTRHPNSNHPHDRRPTNEKRPDDPTRRTHQHHHHTTTKRYPVITTPATPRRYPETEVIHRRRPKVDVCNMDYDAITIIRGERFIFKDQV